MKAIRPVGITKGYVLDDRDLIPGSGKKFFSTPFQTGSGAHLALCLGVKQPGRETDHSPPSTTEVKHGAAIPPLLYMISWRDG
jgi:hypothetical protein